MRKNIDRQKLIDRFFTMVDHTATRSSYRQIAHSVAKRASISHEIDFGNLTFVAEMLIKAYEKRAASRTECLSTCEPAPAPEADQEKSCRGLLKN